MDIQIEENRRVVTAGKSAFNIDLDRRSGLWSIKTSEGPLPRDLDGRYTTPAAASLAIKNYLDNHKTRRKD